MDVRCDNAFFVGVTVRDATCGPRGSPFQMPTRLADGLGPESDRDNGSPLSFAPSRPFVYREGIGFPALTRRKTGQLRLLTRGSVAHWWPLCQIGHRSQAA